MAASPTVNSLASVGVVGSRVELIQGDAKVDAFLAWLNERGFDLHPNLAFAMIPEVLSELLGHCSCCHSHIAGSVDHFFFFLGAFGFRVAGAS